MKYKFLILFFTISTLSIVSSATITKPSTTVVPPVKITQPTTKTVTPTAVTDTTDSIVYDEAPQNFNPIVTITADGDEGSTTIEYGTSTLIEWTSENVEYCTEPYIEKSPNYSKQLTSKITGIFKTQNLTKSQTFFINCKHPSGLFVTNSIIVNVEKPPTPTVTITANENEKSTDIEYGASTTISWDSTDTSTSSCNIFSGDASSTNFMLGKEGKSILSSGQISFGNLFSSKLFTISCQNDGGTASSSILINVIPKNEQNTNVSDINNSAKCITLTKNIRYGSNDDRTDGEVSELQTFLSQEDFYKNDISGFDGIGTILAIKHFQKKEGLPATGFVGKMTREKIKEISCGNN